MPAYMLDTDTSSYIMKRSNSNVLRKLQSIVIQEVCISVVTRCELSYGIEVSPRRQKDEAELKAFLLFMPVLQLPSEAAVDYGQIRADLKTRGALIGSNDMLIAAHARCLGLTLVTNNTREYRRVPGLRIENWT